MFKKPYYGIEWYRYIMIYYHILSYIIIYYHILWYIMIHYDISWCSWGQHDDLTPHLLTNSYITKGKQCEKDWLTEVFETNIRTV